MNATDRLTPPAVADRPVSVLRLLEKPLRRPLPAAPALPAWRLRLERWAGLIRR